MTQKEKNKMSDDKFSTVRIQTPLADQIDKHVEEDKNEFGRLVFSSRADFVTIACERYLKDLQKEAAKK